MRLKTYLKFSLIAYFLLLNACSTLTELRQDFADKVFGREPPNPPAVLEEIKPNYAAKIDWSINIGKTNKYDYTPALDSSAVYAANATGDITKIDIATGRQLWRINAGEAISGGVGIGAGIVLVGTNKGNLLAFDAAGKLLWKSKLSSEILSVPRYFDGLVIVRTGDNHIFGIDAADGSRKWVYERISPALSLRSSVGLVADSGAVYAGFAGGKMVAIRADNGKLLWEATVAQPKGVTEIERIADITSLPVVDGPLVYAVAYQGRIAAIDRTNGKVVWNREIASYSGLSAEDAKVFVSHTLGAVYSLDYATGKTFWRQGALANRRLTAPLPMSSLIAVGDLEGYIHFLTREEGNFGARIKLDGNAVMSIVPGAKSNQLIAETRDGGIYAVSTGDIASPAESAQPANRQPVKEVVPAAPEPKIDSKPEPTTEEAPSTERSIMFQKDPILVPDAPTENTPTPNTPAQNNSAPGIQLPNSNR